VTAGDGRTTGKAAKESAKGKTEFYLGRPRFESRLERRFFCSERWQFEEAKSPRRGQGKDLPCVAVTFHVKWGGGTLCAPPKERGGQGGQEV
jgi:hypothetical protein